MHSIAWSTPPARCSTSQPRLTMPALPIVHEAPGQDAIYSLMNGSHLQVDPKQDGVAIIFGLDEGF